jgi:two-component system sensor histidine kinase/response regulator
MLPVVWYWVANWKTCRCSLGSHGPAGTRCGCYIRQPMRVFPITWPLSISAWPGMDGITLAHTIKQDPAVSATRLIMCSALRDNDDTARWRDAGSEAYLTKPARQSELFDTISKVIHASQTKRSQSLDTVTSAAVLQLSGHILLAEDNPVNQDVAVRMLEQLGCRVKVAETGRGVITALSQQYFDVVLMDCQMPEMDGFAATEAIRRRKQAAGTSSPIPIIAVTANAMAGDREQCLIAGMNDFLSKPNWVRCWRAGWRTSRRQTNASSRHHSPYWKR